MTDNNKRCNKKTNHNPHWHRPDKDTPIDKWCDGKGKR